MASEDRTSSISEHFPPRSHFPQCSYRGWMRQKYYHLQEHPDKPGLSSVYGIVSGALNDSTTAEAREYIQSRVGRNGEEEDKTLLAALKELDEEEEERETSQ